MDTIMGVFGAIVLAIASWCVMALAGMFILTVVKYLVWFWWLLG